MSVAGGLAVGMEPLPVGTLIPSARTVAASMEVKTIASSFESSLILLAVASLSLTSLTGDACLSATVRRAEDENMGSLVHFFDPSSGPKLSDIGNKDSGFNCQSMP
nr:hypothetical protein [Tanacetum cinerariifolium]